MQLGWRSVQGGSEARQDLKADSLHSKKSSRDVDLDDRLSSEDGCREVGYIWPSCVGGRLGGSFHAVVKSYAEETAGQR